MGEGICVPADEPGLLVVHALSEVIRVIRRNEDKAIVQCILTNDSENLCNSTVTVWRKCSFSPR